MGKDLTVIKEKDGIRGIVPSRMAGSRDRVYGAYLDSLKPRTDERVQIALGTCSDPRFREFLDRINEPRYRKVGLQTIAKACNIDLAEFNSWWQKESVQTAIAIAQTGTVDIAEDLVKDSKSRTCVCEKCDGLGFIAAPSGLPRKTPGYKVAEKGKQGKEDKWIRDCPVCHGEGQVTKPGDAHARSTVLEMAGIISKGKGVQVTMNNYGGASHASAVSVLDDHMTIDIG